MNLAGILGVEDSPLEALNDARSATLTVVAEHLDGNEGALLGHAILCPADYSGNVGSVTVFI